MERELLKNLGIGALASVGVLFLAFKALRVIQFLASTFILPGKHIKSFQSPGAWAVVTGASDGIGREFSLQLAKAGYNVLLASRTLSKLEKLKEEIENNTSSEAEVFVIDFSHPTEEDWAKFEAVVESKGKKVAVLINNVGQSHEMPVMFHETPIKEMKEIIDINCHATMRVTRIVAPKMVERQGGLILTMSSFASVFPTALLATYCGSKSFLSAWSMALGTELSQYNITVDCVSSYLVVSAMSKIRKANMMVPPPKEFVTKTLSKIGQAGGSVGMPYHSTPYWSHALMQFVIDSTLGRFHPIVLWRNRVDHEDIRVRALRKKKREAAAREAVL